MTDHLTLRNTLTKVLAFGCATLLLAANAGAADSASIEFGSGDKTKLARIGVQWKWKNQWWRSNGTHIGGYWDVALGQWRADRFQSIPGNAQNLTEIGLTPVFRLQRDSLTGFYAEFGIGAHLLSELYDSNDKRLSTRFQFGDHLGFGYVLQNNLDIGVKFQHFSNASIKKPNDGVEFVIVRISRPF